MADLTKAELEARLSKAEADLAKALELVEKQNAAISTLTAAKTPVAPTHSTDEVVVVSMVDWPVYAKGSNFECYFNRAGEENTLTKFAFDELVGKYRHWFEDGTLAVSHENIDVATKKRLPVDTDSKVGAKILNSLGTMSEAELKKVWKGLNKNERLSVITAFKRGFIEEKEGYRDYTRISILNGLSNGAFNRELQELGGNLKYAPLDLNN